MIIRWHGHSCFEIDTGARIVIDPHDGRSIGLRPPRASADLVLITHDHFDHNAVRVVNGSFKVIKEPGEYAFSGIKIKGIKAYHDTENGRRRGEITMFKVISEGISLLHVGDLGHVLLPDQISEIGHVDVLMTPVGGTYTVGPKEAYENVKLLKPSVIIPMHYKVPGLSLNLGPVDDFLKFFPESSVIYVGSSVEFTREDLMESPQVWVFSL